MWRLEFGKKEEEERQQRQCQRGSKSLYGLMQTVRMLWILRSVLCSLSVVRSCTSTSRYHHKTENRQFGKHHKIKNRQFGNHIIRLPRERRTRMSRVVAAAAAKDRENVWLRINVVCRVCHQTAEVKDTLKVRKSKTSRQERNDNGR